MKQLGFGCVRLTYNLTFKKAIYNLETAFEDGVTHFDVARLYGFGTAEKILGKFITNKRDKVTVTSKFGYYPGNAFMSNLYVQNFSRFAYRLLKKLPSKQAAQSAANEIVLYKNFNIANAEKSLETSLQALRTDYIDYYLLHEPTVEEANKPDILEFLEKQKQRGTIREYGLGSFANKIETQVQRLSTDYSVLQSDCSFPYNFTLPTNNASLRYLFLFSPFRYFSSCQELLTKDKTLARNISTKLNKDVNKHLLDLFLLHHQYLPASSTTLFASSHNSNIKATIKTWNSLQTSEPVDVRIWEEVKLLFREKLAI